jgi:hypothetical protein
MRLNFRVKVGNITFFAMIAETQTLEGVTSLQYNGSHIVMWDLEGCTLQDAEETLREVQRKYILSHIYIASDAEGSYRAWCFSKVDFTTFLKILLDTKFLDWNFFYWTVKRGKATLRTSNKKNRAPQRLVGVLRSYFVSIPSSCEKVVYDTGVEKRGLTVFLGEGGRILDA